MTDDLFARARRVIPGGVNSPVRAFKAVGGGPRFIARGAGARLWDTEGREYLDLVGSWGPLILGHAHPEVVVAIEAAARQGTSFGAPTENEVRLAEKIVAAVPGIEAVRLVNSGTEAAMSAVRVARAATRRDLIVKFSGHYHGHADGFLVAAGSGAATLGVPDSPGVPEAIAALTLVAGYNDLDSVEALFVAHPEKIAAVIVEPIAGNMGVVAPQPGFLAGLRALTEKNDAILIFDEVITGFRVAWGGAQALCNVKPDLTVLGKIIGGGLPVGAYGGRRDLMNLVAPEGPVYQAGTLSGNPLAVAAGLATLDILEREKPYARLEAMGARLERGLNEIIAAPRLEAAVNRCGSLLTLFFAAGPIRTWSEAARADRTRFAAFHRAMLDRGVYLPPAQFEAWFLSAAHTDEDIGRILEAATAALR